MQEVTFKETPMHLEGNRPQVGDPAPDFTLAARDLKPVSLQDFRGRVVLLSTVPSLDTPVCDTETRRLAKELSLSGHYCVDGSALCPEALVCRCGSALRHRPQ
jgi:peroxiredoxin